VRLTHLVVSKVDATVAGLGTGALDELGEDEHAEEEDRRKDRKDGARDRVLGADVGPVVVKT